MTTTLTPAEQAELEQLERAMPIFDAFSETLKQANNRRIEETEAATNEFEAGMSAIGAEADKIANTAMQQIEQEGTNDARAALDSTPETPQPPVQP